MAFYKKNNEEIIKSEDNLFGPGFDLLVDFRDTYSYPVDGWYWFDSDEEAETFLSNIT